MEHLGSACLEVRTEQEDVLWSLSVQYSDKSLLTVVTEAITLLPHQSTISQRMLLKAYTKVLVDQN